MQCDQRRTIHSLKPENLGKRGPAARNTTVLRVLLVASSFLCALSTSCAADVSCIPSAEFEEGASQAIRDAAPQG